MEVEMDASPSYLDPEDHSSREQFLRYGKRHSTPTRSPHRAANSASSSKLKESSLLYDGQLIHSPTNAALLLENIKQEADSYDAADRYEGTSTPSRIRSASKRMLVDGEDESAW